MYDTVTKKGCESVCKPECCEDEEGKVTCATVKVFDDMTHTFIQKDNYKGCFLPKF